MPELPDLAVYLEHIERRLSGRRLDGIRIASPFLLRSVSPTVDDVLGHRLLGATRLGKQIVLALDDELFVVVHLMIAGRLRFYDVRQAIPKRNGLAAFDFDNGTLILTEASRKRRASLRLVRGRAALDELDPGGLEVFDIDFETFFERLRSTPHTVKRALTDQRVFVGIGNAYSDEILFEAGMSPFKLGRNMTPDEARRLFDTARRVLAALDRDASRRGRRQVPRQGHRLPPADGSPRQIPRTLSGVRRPGAAHRARRERVKLLRRLPDRRTPVGRPLAVEAAEEHLPQAHRGSGSADRIGRCSRAWPRNAVGAALVAARAGDPATVRYARKGDRAP